MEKNFKLYMAQSNRPVQFDSGYNKELLDKWNKLDLFEKVNNFNFTSKDEQFVFVDGPPYANGGAHLGHVLNKVWKDLTVKSQWYFGKSVNWVPGWDCHGLPLELQVDKKYQNKTEEEKKKHCKSLALRSVALQRKDFKSLGVHADWNNPYLTLSDEMRKSSWKTVKKMYDEDLLQYKLWPVHHCPACASSLAEAELEYELKERNELYFKYKLTDNTFALVWTTTPWTLPMNQALAYNKNFDYCLWKKEEESLFVDENCSELVLEMLEQNGYKKDSKVNGNYFNGLKGFSPVLKQETPLLNGSFVLSGQTGFVHVAGAHGVEDYQLVVDNKLEPLNLLDPNGRYMAHSYLPEDFVGKKNSQVDELVFNFLGESVLKKVKTSFDTAHCWRHKTKVYYQATWQVFLDLDKLKPKVEKALNDSNLKNSVKENLKGMLLNRTNWCLSRQRYWGTPLNLLVNKETKKLDKLTSVYLELKANGRDKDANDLLNNNNHLYVVEDVLDVWFDSGNVVFALGQKFDFDKADVVLEGKDQYRGWFQSLLWMHVLHYGDLPYKNVLVHGFVLDEKKQKFSKSSGNGLTAKKAVELYNPDVLRLWASMQEHETDAVFSEKKLNEAKTYYQRLRLSLRFLTSNTKTYDQKNHSQTLLKYKDDESFDFYSYVLSKTNDFENEFKKELEQFEYKKALQLMYTFCDKFLSQFVFEVMKQPFYLKAETTKEKEMAQSCAFELTKRMLKCLSVYCPFVAEEFLTETNLELESVFFLKTEKQEFSYKENWDLLQNLRKMVNNKLEPLQQKKLAKGSNELLAYFQLNKKDFNALNSMKNKMSFKYLLSVSQLKLEESSEVDNVEIENLANNQDYKKCPRCWNYDLFKNYKEDVCESCEND